MSQDFLQVTRENATKAYDETNKKGKQLLANLFGATTFINMDNPDNWPTTFEQVCEMSGEDIANYQLPEGATPEEEALNAVKKAWLICKLFRNGWVPDYSNSREGKYYPWFKWSSAGSGFAFDYCAYGSTDSCVGARLSVDSSDKAEHIGKHFTDIYNQFLTL